jgi:hypothetical protein
MFNDRYLELDDQGVMAMANTTSLKKEILCKCHFNMDRACLASAMAYMDCVVTRSRVYRFGTSLGFLAESVRYRRDKQLALRRKCKG